MDYAWARDYLYRLKGRTIKLGLENVKGLLKYLGDPQNDYPSVHVAGTNGKGSVSSIISSCTWRSGERWGLFTSPHLLELTERYRVSDVSITRREFLDAFKEIYPYVKEREGDASMPSFFEISTAVACLHFSRAKVDGAVFEVGLGGRLDATNLVRSELSCITTIGLDHTKALGHTIEEIAYEKAGIIKPGIPVVTGRLPEPAARVVEERARASGSKVVPDTTLAAVRGGSPSLQGTPVSVETPLGAFKGAFPLAGAHQLDNLRTAMALMTLLHRNDHRVTLEGLKEGTEMVHWRGRFEHRPPYLFDICHNEDGARALVNTLDGLGMERVDMVVGILRRKNHRQMLRLLGSRARRLLFSRTTLDEGVEPRELATAAMELCPGAEVSWEDALERALSRSRRMSPPVLVTGSLYTVGEAMGILGLTKAAVSPERLMAELREGTAGEAYLGEHGAAQTPFQVLISTVLSQRTRDENTHKAASALFARAPGPEEILELDNEELERLIRPAGFYRQKAKALKKISRAILDEHGGEVPRDIETLLTLPQVGRKTANCVLVYSFGEDALPVDTHVHRISNLLGLVNTSTPDETEEALKVVLPKKYWKEINGLMVRYGQTVCIPVSPRCGACRLRDFCPGGNPDGRV